MRCSHDRLLGEFLAERDARQQPLGHFLQRDFRGAERAHAMMNAARAEPALRDLKAATFAEEKIARRHAHILEQDFGVAMRRIVEAEDRQHA